MGIMESKENLLTVKELAEALNVHPMHIYRNLSKIPHKRILNCIRFDLEEVKKNFEVKPSQARKRN
jgi:DeoR/GlpR family transcriptional regulator of sugar metabolism